MLMMTVLESSNMQITKLDNTDSTNNWVANHEHELDSTSLVYCHRQNAGRGQRGNSWESEPGKNITASLLLHPENYGAQHQFAISEAVALAITDYLKNKGVDAEIKWPNDIYVGNRKICGILVEHVVTGRNLTRTIAGFGININQKEFLSDAPNPVSLSQITGAEYEIDREIETVSEFLEKYLTGIYNREKLHELFLQNIWRKDDAYYPFFDIKKDEKILGRIENIELDGTLSIVTEEGELRKFAFKEIEFII